MKQWRDFISKTGMIQQKLGDGGDTAQRMGMYWIGQELRVKVGLKRFTVLDVASIADPIRALEGMMIMAKFSIDPGLECPNSPGNYRRTNDESQRHSACDRLTRDQATGIAALMLAGTTYYSDTLVVLVRAKCKAFAWNMLKRFWFTNNKSSHAWEKNDPRVGTSRRDFGGFSLMGMCIRCLNWWVLWPLVCVFDSELVFSAVRYRYFNNRSDVLNHVVRCCIAGNVLPTPSAWLANQINNPDNLYIRMRRYFDARYWNSIENEWDEGPPMYDVYDLDFLRKAMR